MNCSEVRRYLEFCTLGHERIADQKLPLLKRHLSECESCQLAFESQRQFDHEMARTMTEVTIPAGMTDRLKNAVAAASLQPDAVGSARTGHGLSRRTVLSLATVAAMMAGGFWLATRVPPFTEADLRHLAELDISALPNASPSIQVPIPSGWDRVRSIQFAEHSRAAIVGTRQIAMLPMLVRMRSRTPLSPGFLIRLPDFRSQQPIEATSFSSATVQYASFGSWVVWREGRAVYVCVLHDNHAMERLRNAVADGRELT